MINATEQETKKRKVDLIIISDVHLGTYGCRSQELLNYLKSIKPSRVILNGDFIDMWQFRKNYWPKSHMKIVKHIFKWVSKGIPVYYITGNHDEMLRKFAGFKLGAFSIENKLLLNERGKRTWIFHGDVFDVTMQNAKWLTRLGATGYDILILINAFCNWMLEKMGKDKISLSKKIKNSVKSAVSFMNKFEEICADVAIEKGYDNVICGHIHQPANKIIKRDKGEVLYLNSGDWVENCTAIEYHKGEWRIYKYDPKEFVDDELDDENETNLNLNNKQLFDALVEELGSSLARKKIKVV